MRFFIDALKESIIKKWIGRNNSETPCKCVGGVEWSIAMYLPICLSHSEICISNVYINTNPSTFYHHLHTYNFYQYLPYHLLLGYLTG